MANVLNYFQQAGPEDKDNPLIVGGTMTMADGAVQTFVGSSTLVVGETTTGVDDATPDPKIYSRYYGVTTAVTGTGVAGRFRSQITVDSASGTFRGIQSEAGNGSYAGSGDGVNASVITGVYAGVTSSTAGGAKAITSARGIEVNCDVDQADSVITTLDGIFVNFNSSSTGAQHTNVYGVRIVNENTGGNGQTYDAALFIDDVAMAGGLEGWNYGIDMSSGSMTTADIKLQNGETIDNVTDGTVQIVGAIVKHAFDAAAYWTATVTDGGGVEFAAVSDGTADFLFSQPVTVSDDFTIRTGNDLVIGTEVVLKEAVEDGLNCHRVARATYDFDVLTGAQGAIGLGVTLPDNAVVVRSWYEVITGMTSAGNAGTFAVSVEGANDVVTAVDADTVSGRTEGIQDGTIAASIKTTSAQEITFTIAVEDLTAGKVVFFLEYVVSD